ncbi:protein-L-isoaspartate(D-aspartate) O-methyltransferase [Pseudaquabacterium pictum]|jgi:protein-L-isoaspartate(D-aspartate) O-methyltransferase|uniref:Protein-L-isoaspartate O-methyltransferase n=1 Tax=Pseudaquabacterium pictum TaxID=2315236 RepID=A0A480AX38_9BURK|nr:protein-L-isoaspartate(D-aspartate) O-methyltransferase [Rubrivivax pictus]GCL63358.1 protein-L-isoaspartate O-methyltransferase [Rubrivivax pictus]
MTAGSGGARPPRFPLALDQVGRSASAPKPREPLRPQRHLHEAAKDARARPAPQGLGLDSALVRQRMVQRLRAEGIRCEPVFAAMEQVPRHHFVDTALAIQAYEDTSLPIGHGQTISKPSVVARMIELLFEGRSARDAGHLGRALEVGTGCGYQTALLAQLARRVVSIERLRPLFDKAQTNLSAWLPRRELDQVRLVFADGMLGHPPNAPYDSLIAAAGGDELPAAWLDQLAVGGRLVAPMHRSGGRGQVLVVVDRRESGLVRTEHEAVHFVPLKSGTV